MQAGRTRPTLASCRPSLDSIENRGEPRDKGGSVVGELCARQTGVDVSSVLGSRPSTESRIGPDQGLRLLKPVQWKGEPRLVGSTLLRKPDLRSAGRARGSTIGANAGLEPVGYPRAEEARSARIACQATQRKPAWLIRGSTPGSALRAVPRARAGRPGWRQRPPTTALPRSAPNRTRGRSKARRPAVRARMRSG